MTHPMPAAGMRHENAEKLPIDIWSSGARAANVRSIEQNCDPTSSVPVLFDTCRGRVRLSDLIPLKANSVNMSALSFINDPLSSLPGAAAIYLPGVRGIHLTSMPLTPFGQATPARAGRRSNRDMDRFMNGERVEAESVGPVTYRYFKLLSASRAGDSP